MPDCVLLESVDAKTRRPEKSILMKQAALKATCRGFSVQLEAFTEFGQKKSLEIKQKTPLVFDPPNPKQSLEERLKQASPLDVLRVMSQLPGVDMILGVFSYDYIDLVENLPAAQNDILEFPDFVFWIPEELEIIEHTQNTQNRVLSKPPNRHGEEAPDENVGFRKKSNVAQLDPDISDSEFQDIVQVCQEHIRAGDVFQVVLSRTFQTPCLDPWAAYERLKLNNPSPYMFYIETDDFTLFGSSPETFIRVEGNPKTVEICPIAGTKPRGETEDLDNRREAELKLNTKEQAEHMMLVDLARNDVARVSEMSTRCVSELLTIDRYSHVMHLVSRVEGQLRSDLDALHAYQASLNMGTLVGAPKVKAAEILRRIEKTKRGPYGGAVGYLDRHGNMNTAIAIRSALIKNGIAHVRAGAGIVLDSDPASEAQETIYKAGAVFGAINSLSLRRVEGNTAIQNSDKAASILLIDNFDSFTFNLEFEFKNLGCTVEVWRNDLSAEEALNKILKMPEPRLIILSPGPGAPHEAGCCIDLIRLVQNQVPILGVCLGHQALIEAFGGIIDRAETAIHGKSVLMTHDSSAVFKGLSSPMPVARYHSLAGTQIPKEFRVLAHCDNTVMAIEHKKYKMLGLQFHPESILTPGGSGLIQNILHWSQAHD